MVGPLARCESASSDIVWICVLQVFLHRYLERAASRFMRWSKVSAWEEFKPMQSHSPHFLSALSLLLVFTSNHCWHHPDILTRNFGIDTLDLRTCTEIRWSHTFKCIMQDKFATSSVAELGFLTLPERLGICYLFKVMSFINQRYEWNFVCSQQYTSTYFVRIFYSIYLEHSADTGFQASPLR